MRSYVFGCIDLIACNYDELSNTDNGSCIYPEVYYDCNNVCLNDQDGDGVCDELEVLGCTDLDSFNYSEDATDDDGSCIAVVEGCTDPLSLNYDIDANINDDSCCYIAGCTDSTAFNYNEEACYDDETCIDIILGCMDSSAFNYNENANIDDGTCEDYLYGCTNPDACNYDGNSNTDNGSCEYPDEYYDCDGNCINDIDLDGTCDENEVGGCADPNALNYNPDATEDDFCLFTGCLDSLACNFDPIGVYDFFNECEYSSCSGCTDASACNYDIAATLDDDSCIYANANADCNGDCLDGYADFSNGCELIIEGCVNENACNYNENANINDGSCEFTDNNCDTCVDGLVFDNDLDNDGICDSDEIAGCTDSEACNYDVTATDSDSSCVYPLEGFDCDGNELELDTPWGNNDGCDPFNNHTVAFTISDGLNNGDFIGLFYTSENGDLIFSQAVEYNGATFYFTVCGDDATTEEKDGFDIGESFIWQLWPSGEDCAYSIDVEYSDVQSSSGEYEVNGISQVVSISGSSLEVSVLVTDALCNGDLGSAELTVTGGTAPYDIDDLSALSAGSYSTIVTDANGCFVSLDFDVSEPTLLEASISVTDALCNGDLGSAELTVTGGTAPYDIDDLSALSAGSYTTIVTDANGCSVSLDFDISEPTSLEASISVTDALCNGDLGSAELTVTGGTAPYDIDDLSVLSAGSYTTIVTDSNGCSVSLDFDISEPTSLEATISVTDALCNGDLGSAELTVTGGTAPYDIDDLSALSAGSYTTIVTDSNGCSVSLDFDISEPTSLEATVSVTDALCNGGLGSAELIVTGGTAPYDIDDLSALSAGSYSTIVTDSNGCSVSLDFDIVEPEPLDVIVNTENVSCNGDSNGSASIDIIGGSGEYDYEIQVQSESLQENNYSMSFNGDDELILTNVNDFNSDEFTIQLDALLETYGVLFQSNGPHVTFTYSENCGCSNPTNDFNVPSISFRLYSGGWTVLSYPVSSLDLSNPINIAATKNGNSVKLYIDGVLVDEASSGVSSVSGETAIGYDGFTGLIDNVAIWGNSLDINQIDEFMNCPPTGDEIELLNYFNFEEGPDDSPYDLSQGANYSLESINNCFISESVFVDDLDNLSAGDYVITVFDSNGCLDVSEFSILEPEELSLTFDSTAGEYSNCNSGSASVFVDGGTAPYAYLWSNGENTSELLEICGGEYFVTITDSNGCVIEGSVIVDYLVPEGWDVSITDITHTIDIPTDAIMLLDQIDLVSGDYIGVFFDNEDGSVSCGGYVMLIDGAMQLVAYGNDGVNDGFDQDDQFDWKLWDSATETTISGFGVYDDSYSDERFFNAGGESGLLGSVFASHQIIPLNESSYSDWDMISTYISTDENLASIVSPVINELIIIKDANGLVYWPQIPVYTLDNFNTEDAYAIKTYASNELVIYGDFTQPEDVLFELSGWNYMSYPRYFPLDPETVFSEVENSIKLLKDDSGNLYWPELGINTINQMEAGEGYVLKVLSDESFTYPSNSDYVNAIDGSTTAGRIGFNQPVYYSDYETTSSNMVIGIPFDLWIDFDLQYGDEIAVYDTQENIVGVSVLNNDNNVIVVWGDDISSDLKDGMYNGEEFSFELWQQSSNKLYDVKFEWQEGLDYYSENGINIASNIKISSKYDVNIENVYCYPNPSSGEFNLEFYLNDDSDVKVNIYNSIGELVNSEKTFYCYNGTNTLPFSMNHLSQGLYYVKLTTSTENINIVIELTK